MRVLEGQRPDDWVSTCGVCGEFFAVRSEDAPEGNPFPHGTFCPDCQAKGLVAPGVLHWQPRCETIDR
jgi:hypothetical protein